MRGALCRSSDPLKVEPLQDDGDPAGRSRSEGHLALNDEVGVILAYLHSIQVPNPEIMAAE